MGGGVEGGRLKDRGVEGCDGEGGGGRGAEGGEERRCVKRGESGAGCDGKGGRRERRCVKRGRVEQGAMVREGGEKVCKEGGEWSRVRW